MRHMRVSIWPIREDGRWGIRPEVGGRSTVSFHVIDISMNRDKIKQYCSNDVFFFYIKLIGLKIRIQNARAL